MIHFIPEKRLLLLTIISVLPAAVSAQRSYTGSNQCQIRIETDSKEYQFTTSAMRARLNDAMDRFEFLIPLNAVHGVGDSSYVDFLKRMVGESENIIVNAALPNDKDGGLDLSYFKGNQSIPLAGEMMMGKFKFEDDFDFNGMLMAVDNQSMAFNFSMFINARGLTIDHVNNQKLMEIELSAKGDKIIGLTSN
jgi:hypothetical protein